MGKVAVCHAQQFSEDSARLLRLALVTFSGVVPNEDAPSTPVNLTDYLHSPGDHFIDWIFFLHKLTPFIDCLEGRQLRLCRVGLEVGAFSIGDWSGPDGEVVRFYGAGAHPISYAMLDDGEQRLVLSGRLRNELGMPGLRRVDIVGTLDDSAVFWQLPTRDEYSLLFVVFQSEAFRCRVPLAPVQLLSIERLNPKQIVVALRSTDSCTELGSTSADRRENCELAYGESAPADTLRAQTIVCAAYASNELESCDKDRFQDLDAYRDCVAQELGYPLHTFGRPNLSAWLEIVRLTIRRQSGLSASALNR
jgi:hypothetical protein